MKYVNVIALLLVSSLAGCASQGSLDNVRNDVDSIKTRLFSIDKDLTDVREESKVSVGAIEKGFKTDVSSVRKMSADIQASIDSTKTEMQALNGKNFEGRDLKVNEAQARERSGGGGGGNRGGQNRY